MEALTVTSKKKNVHEPVTCTTHISPWATRGPHAPPTQLDFFGILLCIWAYCIRKTRSPAIAEGPRDAGVPVEIW